MINLGATGTNLKIHLHLGITNNKGEWRAINTSGSKTLNMYDMIYSSLPSRSYHMNILKRNVKCTIHRTQLTNFFMISNTGINSKMFWSKLRHLASHSEAVINCWLGLPISFNSPSQLFSLAYKLTKKTNQTNETPWVRP